MLVGAFEIEARRPKPVRPVAQREGVRRAAVEPDVEDVRHLLPFRRVMVVPEEPRRRPLLEPGVRALGPESLGDPRVDRRIAQDLDPVPRPAA